MDKRVRSGQNYTYDYARYFLITKADMTLLVAEGSDMIDPAKLKMNLQIALV